jgi:subtilisin family serine protease
MFHRSRVLPAIATVAVAFGNGLALIAPARAECPRPREGAEEFVGGSHRIEFRPSERYETVTFVSEGVPRQARTGEINRLRERVVRERLGTVLQGSSLERFGTVVVRLNEGVAPDQLRLVADSSRVVGRNRRTGGNPIFDAGDVDHVLVNQIIVQFHPAATQDDINRLLTGICATTVERSELTGRFLLAFEGQTARHALAMVNHLNEERIVQFAQPDVIVIATDRIMGGPAAGSAPACPTAPPMGGIDPFFPQQWHLDHSAGQPGDQNADIGAPDAWSVAKGEDVILAVLDDAVETAHEDLADLPPAGATWNAFTKSDDLKITDQDVHGTPVAGIAAAITGNTKGVKGTAPAVKLMPVRVIEWLAGSNAEPTASYPYSVVEAGIRKAAASGAHVISMSLSLGLFDLDSCDTRRVCQSAVKAAIEDALEGPDGVLGGGDGAVMVIATGNDGEQVAFPAKLAGSMPVIAVGATDNFDKIKKRLSTNDWGSNHGPEISVVAPGIEIVTTDRVGAKGFCSGDYVRFLGTSAATPIVAGVAALMQSQFLAQGLTPLSPQELKVRLQQTATDLAPAGFDAFAGHGRVDACKALKEGTCGNAE